MTTVHHSFNIDDDSYNDDNDDENDGGGPDWSDDQNGDEKVNEDGKVNDKVNDNKEECRATLAKIVQWFDFHLQRKFVQRVKRKVISSIKVNI